MEVTLLGEERTSFTGRMVNISENGMRLLLHRALPMDAAVKVNLTDATILGEVAYCKQDESAYAIGLALDQVLWQTPDLLPLWRALSTHGQVAFPSDNQAREVGS